MTVIDLTTISTRKLKHWLKFTDDLEFWVNPSKQAIDVRSASRLGRKDFSANRQRLEAVRAAYLKQ
ncbi:MAG: DUF1499 domain-containing protein [Burkholderiaceae bacterium]